MPDISADGPPAARDLGARDPRGRPHWRFALLGVGAAVVGLFLGSFLFGGDDTADSATDDSPAGGDAAPAGLAASESAPLLAADEPVDSVAELFRTWNRSDGPMAVVYPSPMGLQVLSDAGTTQPEIEVAVGFEEASRFPLISDGSTSWAVDPNRLETAFLVSTQFVVVDVDREGRVAFINDSLDPPNIGESSFGAWGPGFDLPPEADVLAVPGRGLFVLPTTGGTYEYELNGVLPFSEDVLIAASVDSEVFERCDQELTCELYMSGAALEQPLVLPLDVRSAVWPAPGGRWLISRSPDGESTLHDLVGATAAVIDGTVRAVDWGADASQAALLTDDELVLLRPDSGEVQAVTLPISPSAPTVLLVTE